MNTSAAGHTSTLSLVENLVQRGMHADLAAHVVHLHIVFSTYGAGPRVDDLDGRETFESIGEHRKPDGGVVRFRSAPEVLYVAELTGSGGRVVVLTPSTIRGVRVVPFDLKPHNELQTNGRLVGAAGRYQPAPDIEVTTTTGETVTLPAETMVWCDFVGEFLGLKDVATSMGG